MMILSKKKTPHFREKYLVLSYLKLLSWLILFPFLSYWVIAITQGDEQKIGLDL